MDTQNNGNGNSESTPKEVPSAQAAAPTTPFFDLLAEPQDDAVSEEAVGEVEAAELPPLDPADVETFKALPTFEEMFGDLKGVITPQKTVEERVLERAALIRKASGLKPDELISEDTAAALVAAVIAEEDRNSLVGIMPTILQSFQGVIEAITSAKGGARYPGPARAEAAPVRRGPGRPRKDGSPAQTRAARSVARPAGRRGPGRPRKDEAPRRGPGRPPKAPGARRGPGRPRKTAPAAQ